MKAYKIDVDNNCISEIDYDGSLEAAQTIVEGLIDIFHWSAYGVDVIINDEGNYCFSESKGYWLGIDFLRPIVGNALIVGTPDRCGNATPCLLDIDHLRSIVCIFPSVVCV